MSRKLFEDLEKDGIRLAITFVVLLVILKISFGKESVLGVIRMGFSLFWLFVLPGYALLLYWKDKIDFVEHVIVGTILCAGLMGIISYYVALMGLDIKFHSIVLPILFIGVGLFGYWKREKSS